MRKLKTVAAAAGAALLWSTSQGYAQAAGPKYDFGTIAVTAAVKRVPAGGVRDKDCWTNDPGCTFFLPRDGITYSIDDDMVVRKTMLAVPGNASRLPYSLALGDTKDRALAKVSARLGLKFTCVTDRGAGLPDGTDCYSDRIGHGYDDTLRVGLQFTKAGRLFSVFLSQSGPSD